MNYEPFEQQRFVSPPRGSMAATRGPGWQSQPSYPQVRSFATFSPVPMLIQGQAQQMPIRSSSPITIRSVSPIPFSQPNGSPVLTHFGPPVQERYPSPILGSMSGSMSNVYSFPTSAPVHMQSPGFSTIHVLQHSPLPFQPPPIIRGRGSPSLGVEMVGAPRQTASFQSNNFSYQQGDPSLLFMARMQQRQNAQQQLEVEWQKWEGNGPLHDERELPHSRNAHGTRESRGMSPGRANTSSVQNPSNLQSQRTSNSSVRSLMSMTITVIAARNLPAIRGTCNPYCTVRYGRQVQKTSVCFESINPRWNQPCTVSVHESDTDIGISVLHWDQTGNEELIGVVSFTTTQVLAGLSERAFVIKYLDGTAIIGNDGCPAYLDIAVDTIGQDPTRDVGHDFRRAASPPIQRISSFESQRSVIPDQFKVKQAAQQAPIMREKDVASEIQDDQREWRRERAGRERMFGTSDMKSVHEYQQTSNHEQRNIYHDNPLGSLQEFQKNSMHESQRKEMMHTSKSNVSETNGSLGLDSSKIISHEASFSGENFASQRGNSSWATVGDNTKTSVQAAEKQTTQDSQRALMNDLERSLLLEVQKNSVIIPQRSSLGSTNGSNLPSGSAKALESNVSIIHNRLRESNGRVEPKNQEKHPVQHTSIALVTTSTDYERRERSAPVLHSHYGEPVDSRNISKHEVPSLHESNAGYIADPKERSLYASSAGNVSDTRSYSNRAKDKETFEVKAVSKPSFSMPYMASPHNTPHRNYEVSSNNIWGKPNDIYSVGIKITDGPPYLVSEVQSLMDENCVLQGIQGFKYEPITAGDRLVMLDGVPVEHLSSKDVDRTLKGPMLSICEIIFENAKTRHQNKILAMRHILLRSEDSP